MPRDTQRGINEPRGTDESLGIASGLRRMGEKFGIPAAQPLTASRARAVQAEWKNPQPQGQQLPMFMSAREIMAKHQPLMGDREEAWDPREGETTARALTTGGMPNAPIKTHDREGWLKNQWPGGIPEEHTHYRQFGHTETDQQLWDRKLEESRMPFEDYHQMHAGGYQTGSNARRFGTPDYEDIMEASSAYRRFQFPGSSAGSSTWEEHQDAVDRYVDEKQWQHRWNRDQGSLYESLQDAMRPGGEGFTGLIHLGTQDPGHDTGDTRPEVYGAHHRIAAMNEIDPDRLMPVIHHKQFRDARAGGQYKYT